MVDLEQRATLAALEVVGEIIRYSNDAEGVATVAQRALKRILKEEGDRRAEDMRERCAAVSAQYAREGDHPECNATNAIRSLPLEKK